MDSIYVEYYIVDEVVYVRKGRIFDDAEFVLNVQHSYCRLLRMDINQTVNDDQLGYYH